MFKTLIFDFLILLLLQSAVSNSFKKQEINQAKNYLKRDLEQGNYIAFRVNGITNYICTFNMWYSNDYRKESDISWFGDSSQCICERTCILWPGADIKMYFNKQMTSLTNYFNSEVDSNMENAIAFDFSNFDSSKVINYNKLFNKCENLKFINFTGLKLNGNNINMENMFKDTNSLKYLYLLNIQYTTSNLNNFINDIKSKNLVVCQDQNKKILPGDNIRNLCCDFDYMDSIRDCHSTKYKIKVKYRQNATYNNDFGNSVYRNKNYFLHYQGKDYVKGETITIDTNVNETLIIYFSEPITSLAHFFSSTDDENVKKIYSIDFSELNSPNIDNMEALFYGCTSLSELNFSSFNTKKVTNMGSMFYGCSSLVSLNLSSFDTEKVTNMSKMFYNCNSLIALIITNFYTESLNLLSEIFTNVNNLAYIDIYNIKANNDFKNQLNGIKDKVNLLLVCQKDTIITSPAKSICCNIDTERKRCKSTNYINIIYGEDTTYEKGFINEFRKNIEYINTETSTFLNTEALTIEKNTSIELNFRSDVKVLSHLFDINFDPLLENIISIDFSHLVIPFDKNTSFLFNGLKSIRSIDLSNSDLSSLENMTSMFENCISLEEIKFPTSLDNLNDISSLFSGCISLKSVDLSGFNTTSVTNMNSLFKGCTGMQFIYIPNFITSSVTDMSSMFSGCTNLKILNIDNFNMEKVESAENIFNEINNLKYISINNIENENTYISNSIIKDIKKLTVCQKENIITNEDALYICCYFDYDTEKCITNFIEITFNEKVDYENGFGRDGIDFLIYKTYDKKSNTYELSINPNEKLTIYISNSTTSLENFFNSDNDKNVDKINSIDLSYLNTSEIKNINSLFKGCKSLKQIDLTNFNTSLVTNMSYLFYGCESLVTIDLTNFNTPLVTDMS